MYGGCQVFKCVRVIFTRSCERRPFSNIQTGQFEKKTDCQTIENSRQARYVFFLSFIIYSEKQLKDTKILLTSLHLRT